MLPPQDKSLVLSDFLSVQCAGSLDIHQDLNMVQPFPTKRTFSSRGSDYVKICQPLSCDKSETIDLREV